MITVRTKNLDLRAIAESGQCFRWRECGGGYCIAAMDRVLYARQADGELTLDCERAEFDAVWRDYFDLDTDYAAIAAGIPAEDEYLRAAAAYGGGIRILRQEPWEALVTFIISQRRSIPAIRQAVEKLCAAVGRVILEDGEGPVYAFPGPEEIAALPMEALARCSLGYRAPYVRAAAEAFCFGGMRADALRAMDDAALKDALLSLYGVGEKVAQCVMLFGFHRMNAFPVDVWMGRVRDLRYPRGIPMADYAPWAGVMQQYMFAYERFLEGKA